MTKVGPYVVREGLRQDNPAWPVYLVYRGERFIGKQFSVPSESDCEWLERTNGRYVHREENSSPKPYGYSVQTRKRGRPTNEERARRALAEIPE